ncbi:t-SNARE [Cristinia sonorae]|uniref:t-SNARE n=1 Tax=Cristinia sonorae TaxID=1940300 RepID=A0A8K0URQ2_9AGAR|nr:t-SNARE [Cristinia sonorae]
MSTDPYHAVQQEIQSSLQTASTLRSSYLRIRSTAREDTEELVWARNELKATLAALEADLEDLEESVKIVETTGPRMFGLEEAEVISRRRYVGLVRSEIENMRAELETGVSYSRPTAGSSRGGSMPSSPPPDDEQAEWARQEQQMMIRQQDETITTIAGTLSTLAEQAGLMGHEIGEHNEMLDDLEQGVDRSDAKLNTAMRKMKKFIRQTEETKSGWCIGILIVVLMLLLLAVILI